jgi:AcrR family transcriptional regulator
MELTPPRKKSRTSRTQSKPPEDLPADSRDRLIKVAKTLFAEKGFDGATVKEIAESAGLNISLISYHFMGKEGLYRTCLEQLGKARLAVAERVLQEPNSMEEFRIRLHMFMEELLTVHVEEPELSRIVTRECEMNLPIAQDIFKNTFLKVYETMVNFFRSAQKKQLLRKDLDVEIVTGVLFGGLLHMAQKDRVSETFFGRTIRDRKHRDNIIETSISFCLQGCATSQGIHN